MADFDIVRADALSNVPHGFFGHGGEQHQFGFGGPGDASAVQAMRAAAANTMVAGAPLVAPHQVHSPDVLAVNGPWGDDAEGRPVADALVSSNPEIVLGIVTADCAPVLFADPQAGVVGAAHAGWRGANGGVLENTLAAMDELGASRGNVAAAIGPTIAQSSYEVDAPFRDNFAPADDRFFAEGKVRDGEPRWQFDLPGYIAARLAGAGLTKVQMLDLDTFSLPVRFYSYRRASQAGEPNYGRQISMIAAPQ